MTTSKKRQRTAQIAAFTGLTLLAAACGAEPGDYAWEAAPAEVDVGQNVRVAVRLEGPSGVVALPPEAVASARLDMGPDGMASMAAPLRPVAPADGESLAWETDLSMGGRWALEVTASVPGQAEPLTGEVVITAAEP